VFLRRIRRILAIKEIEGIVTWISLNRARLEIVTLVPPYEKMMLRILRRRLRRIPIVTRAYRFRYITVLGFIPEVIEIEELYSIPRMAYSYVERISEFTGIPKEQVLRSRPVKRFIERLEERVYLT